jgi:3'-phosphoadenosine 5'-phosphosulfate sulfotransferase (PAPS reductase)/FAD synthetase
MKGYHTNCRPIPEIAKGNKKLTELILKEDRKKEEKSFSSLKLLRSIPKGKVIVVAFPLGESSAYMLGLILDKYRHTHRIIVCCCNTGSEDEESLEFGRKIEQYYGIEIMLLEYRRQTTRTTKKGRFVNVGNFERVTWDTAYRETPGEEAAGFPNHPFRFWIEDYGLPAYPNRTCTREMKERTITRYLSSIGVMPRDQVRCVGIRFDELDSRTPNPENYYELILQGVTKARVNQFFENEMPFRLEIPSWLGNCGACISKSIRNLCTIARKRPEKFAFFRVISKELGVPLWEFYRERNSIDSIFEKSTDQKIKDAHDNRFDLGSGQIDFDFELDSEGACGGTCEPFS